MQPVRGEVGVAMVFGVLRVAVLGRRGADGAEIDHQADGGDQSGQNLAVHDDVSSGIPGDGRGSPAFSSLVVTVGTNGCGRKRG
jgi:hypothetical protein